uniref:Uncharacterized protein n=1 Tax=Tanacetum cinerariifolium TaxID=118510 RepID=A0A699GL51_TANCI|nr:hypothetical protein [Tanacetum cinerariifolium]
MEQCRQGKSAKWIRNLGKRIGSKGWARGSQFRTRRLSADCSSCSRARAGRRVSTGGQTRNGSFGGLPRASNSQLRTGKGSQQNGSVTSGKGLALRAGHGGPSFEPVGCRRTARAAHERERVVVCRPGDRLGTALSGAFPGRRTANSELVRTRGI